MSTAADVWGGDVEVTWADGTTTVSPGYTADYVYNPVMQTQAVEGQVNGNGTKMWLNGEWVDIPQVSMTSGYTVTTDDTIKIEKLTGIINDLLEIIKLRTRGGERSKIDELQTRMYNDSGLPVEEKEEKKYLEEDLFEL